MKSTNTIDLIPVRKTDHEITEDDKVCLLIPKFRNEKFARWFIPRRKSLFFTVKLDEIGSYLWLAIDGQKNISELGEILSEKFGKRVQPPEETITKFASQLYQNEYIIFKQLIPTNEINNKL